MAAFWMGPSILDSSVGNRPGKVFATKRRHPDTFARPAAGMVAVCWVRVPNSMRSTLHHKSGSRTVVIAAAVVAFHALALWALQAGLLHRTPEMVVPVHILSEVIEPPRRAPPAPPLPAARPPTPQRAAKAATAPVTRPPVAARFARRLLMPVSWAIDCTTSSPRCTRPRYGAWASPRVLSCGIF